MTMGDKIVSPLMFQAKLGEFREKQFTEPAVTAAMKRFKAKLFEISESIRERNEVIARPYTRLLPDLIPNAMVA